MSKELSQVQGGGGGAIPLKTYHSSYTHNVPINVTSHSPPRLSLVGDLNIKQ